MCAIVWLSKELTYLSNCNEISSVSFFSSYMQMYSKGWIRLVLVFSVVCAVFCLATATTCTSQCKSHVAEKEFIYMYTGFNLVGEARGSFLPKHSIFLPTVLYLRLYQKLLQCWWQKVLLFLFLRSIFTTSLAMLYTASSKRLASLAEVGMLCILRLVIST